MKSCVVCGSDMLPGRESWHFVCPRCHYEGSTLDSSINESVAHGAIDEDDREVGLRETREENFKRVVDLVGAHAGPGRPRLLDVGAAHGWFLEAAAERFDPVGVEPDTAILARAEARGFQMRAGFFPEALAPDEVFDVIVFNDVIEHIPDIRAALKSCHERLAAGGLLVLNLPNSRGLFFRLARVLARAGWTVPSERLWQVDFPSPHVHYFSPKNLTLLVRDEGFAPVATSRLYSVRVKGLRRRMRFSTGTSWLNVQLQYLGALLAVPVTRVFPSDAVVCVYRKV